MQRHQIRKDIIVQSRGKLDNEVEAVEEPTKTLDEQIDGNSECVNMVDVACETDDCSWMSDKAGEIYALQGETAQLKEENCSLQAEVVNLKKKLQSASLSAECLENDKNKLKFYTSNNASYFLLLNVVSIGLTEWCIFSALYKLIASDLPESPRLTKLAMLLMFFLKIHLNLFDEDIGYRFDVHLSTISRNFHRVLYIRFVKTSPLIKWPERDVLRETMPMSFRKFFKKCCVIIDCTEIFMEQPTDLLVRAQVWSNYKHHSTIKFLIDILPQGTISFLSPCVRGRMSDKEITEQSGLLQHLLPGNYMITVLCCHTCTERLLLYRGYCIGRQRVYN